MLEAVMFEEAMYRNDIHIGDVFEYPIYGGLESYTEGQNRRSSQAADGYEPYWYQGMEGLLSTFQISEAGIR